MKHAARSSTRNIAWGVEKQNHKDYVHFIRMSKRSIDEDLDDLLTANIEEYIGQEELIEVALKLTYRNYSNKAQDSLLN